jgi:hypothetical protein
MWHAEGMSTRTPIQPEPIDPETELIIRERLATFDQDKKKSKPWNEVKARILQTLKPR